MTPVRHKSRDQLHLKSETEETARRDEARRLEPDPEIRSARCWSSVSELDIRPTNPQRARDADATAGSAVERRRYPNAA